MSIVNLHIAPDRVWMVCDSVQFDMDGEPYSFASKFTTFPHIIAVVGFRGLVALHRRVDAFLNGGGRVLDVEDGAERLPDQLRRWRAELRERHPGHDSSIIGQLWLCGWRPSTKAFGGWRMSSEDDFEPLELAVPGTWLNPGNDYAPPPAVLDSPSALIRIGEVQKRMSAANREHGGADLGIGGELLLCELTRGGISLTKAHRFDDFAETKERIRHAR